MKRNAKVIIPFVLIVWLGSLVVFRAGTPAVVGASFVVAVAVAYR